MEGEDADVVQSPDQISVISAPVVKPEEQKTEVPTPQTPEPEPEPLPMFGYCFALYDYDAEGEDELNLEEGQVGFTRRKTFNRVLSLSDDHNIVKVAYHNV